MRAVIVICGIDLTSFVRLEGYPKALASRLAQQAGGGGGWVLPPSPGLYIILLWWFLGGGV